MKMKIILFPFSVVAALWIAIGYVKPDVVEILNLRQQIAAQEDILASIQQRIDRIAQFSSALDQNAELEESALHYLPRTQESEAMVDTINFLANQVGVSVLAMDFSESETPAVAPVPVSSPPPSAEVLALGNSGMIAVAEESPVIPVTPRQISAEVVGNGSYQSVKNFLYRLSHTNRFLNFDRLSVDHTPVVTANQEGTTTDKDDLTVDSLQISARVKFTYFPKVNDIRNASASSQEDAFMQELDLDTIKSMEEFVAAASAEVPSVTVSGAGKENPFLK